MSRKPRRRVTRVTRAFRSPESWTRLDATDTPRSRSFFFAQRAASAPASFLLALRSGEHGEIGPRRSMEDATFISEPTTDGQCAFYGVFDGHGGRAAADFVGARLIPNIRAAAGPRVSGDALQKSLRDAYFQTDREFREAASEDDAASGATALVVCVASDPEAGTSELVVANAGDCRVVLSRAGKAIDLSTDQRPNCSTETSRIESAGGFVEDGYVNGYLGVSRAFGNFHLEGLKGTETAPGPLTVAPEVERWRLTGEDEFLVIACDGLWDVFSSNNAVDFARRALRAHNDPARTARELCAEAGRRDSADNVSVIVVCFSLDPPPDRAPAERTAPPMVRAISSEGLSELQKALRSDDEAAVEAQMTSPNLGLGRRLMRVASINPSSPSRGRDGTGSSGFSEFSAGLEVAAMTPLAEESSRGLGESL